MSFRTKLRNWAILGIIWIVTLPFWLFEKLMPKRAKRFWQWVRENFNFGS